MYVCKCKSSVAGRSMYVCMYVQMLLVLSQKYPPLASKLAWGLLASLADYLDFKRIHQVGQVRSGPHVCMYVCTYVYMCGVISNAVWSVMN